MLGSIALGLLYVRRPARVPQRRVVLVAARGRDGRLAAAGREPPPDPLFAYYYIWFNADSWNRAKIDYPLLGRYSSDDRGSCASTSPGPSAPGSTASS